MAPIFRELKTVIWLIILRMICKYNCCHVTETIVKLPENILQCIFIAICHLDVCKRLLIYINISNVIVPTNMVNRIKCCVTSCDA